MPIKLHKSAEKLLKRINQIPDGEWMFFTDKNKLSSQEVADLKFLTAHDFIKTIDYGDGDFGSQSRANGRVYFSQDRQNRFDRFLTSFWYPLVVSLISSGAGYVIGFLVGQNSK
ncbi:hypothetical protein PUV52_09275 [Leuconostoc mesenteroides]|uniref:Uncharacterized protein n=1 Tax=Leuconostoc mesenteroides subsp. mesenteroides (strain ATCC 8293 / DSM 20343 / BCRC 11652 / CCM 1803 / JCM 6124 / NCDO 523 / NBRC 100496 / NCIMB 8023 / NCTC 12954 / NRRL B-1118 / 37Y) TaxID=203120 RepID=Q03VJ5_LEUMM|nr:hypothetical protein [Leuconostoc mesenteroides]ABJ62777.1 hypothetical protein LEUM_1685 [Leuconostoc mesenteroides subsp. mesenteroides ATCC 8293]MCT3042564.1 hypothetical protein [Leuconostoc mesenteroides]MDG9747594.1 hypothetical protein [Leuconostoc mesenteroides]QQB30461.1 hypothetical protein I6H90_06345 [Leuconostoc mesenteroides]SPE14662.1 hypothetical protein LEM9268_01510 [Leuconostoc mesenteroides]